MYKSGPYALNMSQYRVNTLQVGPVFNNKVPYCEIVLKLMSSLWYSNLGLQYLKHREPSIEEVKLSHIILWLCKLRNSHLTPSIQLESHLYCYVKNI